MVPRQNIFFNRYRRPKEILEKIMESGYSRIPVYEDSIDNIIGILYQKKLSENILKQMI